MGVKWDGNRAPLGERVARMSTQASTSRVDGPTRHVWVLLGRAGDSVWTPGLLRRWERRQDGWWAEVVSVDDDGEFGVRLMHQRWVRPATQETSPAME